MKQAKQNAPEPPQQPKIKLKVPQNIDTPSHPKRITIHVGGKASAGASPAPGLTPSGDGDVGRNGTPLNRTPFVPPTANSFNAGALDKTRSISASVASPSPSATGLVKPEDSTRQSPVVGPTTTFQQFAPHPSALGIGANGISSAVVAPPPPKRTAADILEAQKYRAHPISKPSLPLLMIFLCANTIS